MDVDMSTAQDQRGERSETDRRDESGAAKFRYVMGPTCVKNKYNTRNMKQYLGVASRQRDFLKTSQNRDTGINSRSAPEKNFATTGQKEISHSQGQFGLRGTTKNINN